MDDLEFSQLYKSVLDVLWNFILFRTFPTQQAAENAASQLFSYAACKVTTMTKDDKDWLSDVAELGFCIVCRNLGFQFLRQKFTTSEPVGAPASRRKSQRTFASLPCAPPH